MSAMASQITGVLIVCSAVCSGADQRKHQSSTSLDFVGDRWFPSQRASNAENDCIWWRHHVEYYFQDKITDRHSHSTLVSTYLKGIVPKLLTKWSPLKCAVYYVLYRANTHQETLQGTKHKSLYSLNGETSFRQFSRSLEAESLDVIMIISLWHLTDISQALQPRYLLNFRGNGKVNTRNSRLRDFTRSCG